VTNTLLTENLSEPLDGVTTAKVEIDSGTGNLIVDRLPGEEHVLATGTLEYFENQGAPTRSVTSDHGQAILRVKGGRIGRPWFRLPWEACIGATDWRIHLNPGVSSDITAHTGGGNVKLDLAGLAVTRLSADTGGGNVDVVLPDHAANLSVAARTGGGNIAVAIGSDISGSNTVEATSGAGNVAVHLPSGVAARVHATSGLGKVTVESRFARIDRSTFQSPDYDSAVNKVDITLRSGAGNVSVNTD
jgi:hypothetical protein